MAAILHRPQCVKMIHFRLFFVSTACEYLDIGIECAGMCLSIGYPRGEIPESQVDSLPRFCLYHPRGEFAATPRLSRHAAREAAMVTRRPDVRSPLARFHIRHDHWNRIRKWRKITNIRRKIIISSCSCLCPSHWNHVLNREWRCSWSSADRRCSKYIWVINNFIAY